MKCEPREYDGPPEVKAALDREYMASVRKWRAGATRCVRCRYCGVGFVSPENMVFHLAINSDCHREMMAQ